MDIEKYKERIGFSRPITMDTACLKSLQRCHVMSIPFEALDVTLKNEIRLDIPSIYDKVVNQYRGGYCYELNYLFHTLLSQVGFDSSMVSSRIFNNEAFGPEFDHMSLIVQLDEPWLVDVGYGDLLIEPLQIYSDSIQEDGLKKYKIERLDENRFLLLESLKNKMDFRKKYSFDLTPRRIEEFSDQNNYKQSSPESYFVKNTICTMPTPSGRKIIMNNHYKVRTEDQTQEREIKDNSDLVNLLREQFNINLENTAFNK